jgi:hypothetical protein
LQKISIQLQDKISNIELKIKQYSILTGELPNPTKRYANNLANIYAGAQPLVIANNEKRKSVDKELKLPRILSKKAAENLENLKEKLEGTLDLPVNFYNTSIFSFNICKLKLIINFCIV